METNQLNILKSEPDIKVNTESNEDSHVDSNAANLVGNLQNRAGEKEPDKEHQISDLCLVLESSTLSDIERYGKFSHFH